MNFIRGMALICKERLTWWNLHCLLCYCYGEGRAPGLGYAFRRYTGYVFRESRNKSRLLCLMKRGWTFLV